MHGYGRSNPQGVAGKEIELMKRMLLVLTATAIIAALMATSAYAQAAPEEEWEPGLPQL
jgi:hypothetical protein